jgi:DNA-binding NtrC family response regulator
VSKTKQHILIVDDELEIRKIIQEILSEEGYSTETASSANEARVQASEKKPDLVFLDIWMPEEDGISLLKDWKKDHENNFPVIMISGHATIETAIKATKLGASDFIEKPISMEKLLISAKDILSQNLIMDDVFTHLIHNTTSYKELLESFQTKVQQKKILAIQAEEGLEKAAWAKTIHLKYLSENAEFKNLQNSQQEALEEHKKNDYLAAFDSEKGLTAYIDNLKKLSDKEKTIISQNLNMHSKNQNKKIILGITDRDEISFLENQSIIFLEPPPLRDLLNEVPYMLDAAIKYFVERDGYGYRRFSLASQNMLSKYQWPGNLRQLADLVQAVLSRKDKEIVNVDEIQEVITLQGPSGNILIENNILSLSMKEAKKLFERAYLTRQLELVGGKMSELSRRVGMERTNLYRKLQSLDVEYKKKKKPTS